MYFRDVSFLPIVEVWIKTTTVKVKVMVNQQQSQVNIIHYVYNAIDLIV